MPSTLRSGTTVLTTTTMIPRRAGGVAKTRQATTTVTREGTWGWNRQSDLSILLTRTRTRQCRLLRQRPPLGRNNRQTEWAPPRRRLSGGPRLLGRTALRLPPTPLHHHHPVVPPKKPTTTHRPGASPWCGRAGRSARTGHRNRSDPSAEATRQHSCRPYRKAPAAAQSWKPCTLRPHQPDRDSRAHVQRSMTRARECLCRIAGLRRRQTRPMRRRYGPNRPFPVKSLRPKHRRFHCPNHPFLPPQQLRWRRRWRLVSRDPRPRF